MLWSITKDAHVPQELIAVPSISLLCCAVSVGESAGAACISCLLLVIVSLLTCSSLFLCSDKELLGPEVVTTLHFLQSFVRLAQLPLNVLEQRIPNMILSEFQYLATPLK